jgi:NhaC family Na+:H+ antiporter
LVNYLRNGFGGIMDAIGALSRISQTLLKMAHTFGLFASTVWKLYGPLNITASDQYLVLWFR